MTAPSSNESPDQSAKLLELYGLVKRFGEAEVLRGINFTVRGGRIHALLGANGAGKSTLVKHLSGYHEPSECSTARLRGKGVTWPLSQHRDRIMVMHQDPGLVSSMSVLDNLLIARASEVGALARRSRSRDRRHCQEALRLVGLSCSPDALVSHLTLGERALLALARLLDSLRDLPESDRGNAIVVLDEPTAALPLAEAQGLLATLGRIAATGAGVVLVTHRLQEVRLCADEITVLRDGNVVYAGPTPPTDKAIETLMFGEATAGNASPQGQTPVQATRDKVFFRLVSSERPDDASELLSCARGEVVGVTGLAGAGTDLLPYRAIGAREPSLVVEIGGTRYKLTPRTAARAGVRIVPGNRATQAVWLGGTAIENYAIAGYASRSLLRLIPRRAEHRAAQAATSRLGVSPPDVDLMLGKFSGGNQQKIVMSRFRADSGLRLLLVHEPTQGIDLKARHDVIDSLRQLARDADIPVVIFSMDSEVLALAADRVLVMNRDAVVKELSGGFDDKAIETAVFLSDRRQDLEAQGGQRW